jgi:hypothetical protein
MLPAAMRLLAIVAHYARRETSRLARVGLATWSVCVWEGIAAAMLYHCSDEAGAINGARIPLCGRG